MSFLTRIFGDRTENSLLDLYTGIWARMQQESVDAARGEVAQWINEAKREAQRDGDAALPRDHGEILLARERTDPQIQARLAIKRAEGVTDTDIRWWWNLNYIERRLVLKIDNMSRMAVFIQELRTGRTPDDATRHIWKYFPNYGNENEVSAGEGNDRLIPYELKDRLNTWLEKQSLENASLLKERLDQTSSFNAVVRAEIRAGML